MQARLLGATLPSGVVEACLATLRVKSEQNISLNRNYTPSTPTIGWGFLVIL